MKQETAEHNRAWYIGPFAVQIFPPARGQYHEMTEVSGVLAHNSTGRVWNLLYGCLQGTRWNRQNDALWAGYIMPCTVFRFRRISAAQNSNFAQNPVRVVVFCSKNQLIHVLAWIR